MKEEEEMPKKMEEVTDGIFMEPVPITLGEEVRLKYKGMLSNAAGKVYLHTGYGAYEWCDVKDHPMRKTRDGGWTATVKVTGDSRFNFCFHDAAMNWDNNNGHNWSYEIHNGGRRNA